MISTATILKLKRSGVPGRKPTLADLQLGELGINYNDGKLFFRQENDVVGARIIEPGQGDVIGKTIFVSTEGDDNNSGLNERDAKRSIKSAASIAEPGDSIKVYPGQYVEDNPIRFRDRVSVEGMELRNVLVTPANPSKDLYQVGEAFHATNHSFVSNQDSTDGAAIITFRPLEGTASDRYFDAARLIRDNLDFIAGETVGFLTSGYSGYAADQRSQDGARAIELNRDFIVEEAFQYINSPDYTGPNYFNPDPTQCRSDLGDILDGWRYDLISDGNSASVAVGLTYYAPIEFVSETNIRDLVYDNTNGLVAIETELPIGAKPGDRIKLQNIVLDCDSYKNEFFISNFSYDNENGLGTVTLPFIHSIEVGDSIKLENLKFDCPPYGAAAFDIDNFVYDEITGSSVITLSTEHTLKAGDAIELRNIQFDCPAYGGEFTDVVDLEYNNVSGTGIIKYASPADLSTGDEVYLFDIKMTCPPYGNAISVSDFDYDNFTGVSEITVDSPHNLKAGDLIKLENLKFSCSSYLDETFRVVAFDYNNFTGEAVVTLDSNHSYGTDDKVELDGLTFACGSYFPQGIDINAFNYNQTTGVSTIELHAPHNLSVGDTFRLEDVVFECNSYTTTDIAVSNSSYEEQTGFVTIDLASDHNTEVGQRVILSGLEYSCVNSGITTTLFPSGANGFEFEVLATPTSSRFIVNVGVSSIAHNYVGGGTATVGLTTTVFPDGTQGFDFTVTDIVNATTVETNVGISTIAHTYVSGGKFFVGFTTTIFPDGTQGSLFDVHSIPSANQIALNVGVSSIAHTYVNGGTVSSVDSFIEVADLEYDALNGTGLLTLSKDHGLIVGENFILEDLKFSCNSYTTGVANTLTISNFLYDNETGISTITVEGTHGLIADDTFALYDIEFICPGGSGITTNIFPDGSVDNFYDVLSVPGPNTIITRVGTSTIPHSYVRGGLVQTGITTNIFPDGTRPGGNFFNVDSVPAPNQILTTIGVSSIAHDYVSGGKFYTGITTNIFPQTFTDPNVNVVNAVYDNVLGSIEIITDKPHGLTPNAPVLLQGLEFSCNSGGSGNSAGSLTFPRNQEVYTVAAVNGPTSYTCIIGPNSFVHTYVQGGTSTRQNILDAKYNERTGELEVKLNESHGYVKGDSASVVDLLFSCQSGGRNNAPGQLIFPRPTDEFVVVTASGTELTLNVGAFPGLPHEYLNGGSLGFNGTTVSVVAALYNETTGELRLSTSAPLGAPAGATVTMQGLNFLCESGGPGNDAGTIVFPRLDKPVFKVTRVVDLNTYVINVGKSVGLPHTYVSGGFSSLKKRANDQNIFRVDGVISPTKVVANVGVSSIAHDYVSGGNLFVGITTNVFPDGTRPQKNRFDVISVISPNSALINIGVSTIPHTYESGGRMQFGDTNRRDVIAFDYDNRTGISTVTVRGLHNLTGSDLVKLTDLEFVCENSPGITTNIFPDGTAASLNIFPVRKIINASTFETNVGRVDFKHTYLRGGSAFTGITTNIFPDGTQGYNFTVDRVVSPTQVSVNVGTSEIQHDYVRGGQLFAGKTNERDIADFSYDHVGGSAILTLRRPEESLSTGDLIKLKDLKFDCPNSTGITTNIFPDGTQGFLFPITERLNKTQFQLKVGPSPFAHNYVRGTGAAFIGITTDVFPDGTRPEGNIFEIVSIPAPNKVTARVGTSTIPHNYVGGGTLQVGINTNIFPGDSVVSPLGDTFDIQAIGDEGELIINVGLSTISHRYVSGGQVLYGTSPGGELQHITGPGVSEATVAAIEFERDIAEYAINNRPWGSFIAAETARVEDFQYNNVTGFATVISGGINVERDDVVRLSNIEFRCSDEYAGLTTTFFPDGTRPDGNYFTVDNRIDVDTFEIFVGISSINHVYNRGGNVYRYRQNVQTIDYNNVTGFAEIESTNHGFRVGDIVELGDARFACDVFTPDYDVENFVYDNTTGLSTVTTTLDNDIVVGDRIRLDDLRLECPPYGDGVDIVGFDYNNLTGVSKVFTAKPHGIDLSPRAAIDVTAAVYDGVSGIVTITTQSNINFRGEFDEGVILSGLEFECDPVYAGLTTTTFPEVEGRVYKISSISTPRQFAITVGVSTIPHTYVSGGTATKVKRSDVRLADIKFDCPIYGNDIDIRNFQYDNTSGNSLITLERPHNLKTGDDIKLLDIKFQCPPYNNNFSVIDADYDSTIGLTTITVDRALSGLGIGDKIRVKGLQFDCDSGVSNPINLIQWFPQSRRMKLTLVDPGARAGDSIKLKDLTYRIGDTDYVYPDGRDASLNIYKVLEVVPTTEIAQPPNSVDILIALPNLTEGFLVFIDDGNDYGNLITGITTNIYPDTQELEGEVYDVVSVPSSNQFVINSGINTIPHEYVRFGEAFVGVTTNIFPDPSAQNSPKGDIFPVIDVPAPNQVRINVGISSIAHVYDKGGKLLTGITTNIFPDGTSGDLFPVIGVGNTTEFEVQVGTSTIPHIYSSGGTAFTGITTNIFPGNSQNSPRGRIFEVLSKDEMCPDRFTINVGPSSIPHSYVDGGTVTTGVTTDRFPDGTNGFEFPVASVVDADSFLLQVGPSSISHTYESGGFVRRLETPVSNYIYDNTTGLSSVTVLGHRLNAGDIVKLRDIKFDCGAYGTEKDIVDFVYDAPTGRATVTTQNVHNILTSDVVKLSGLQLDCAPYGNQRTVSNAIYNEGLGELTIQTAEPHGLGVAENVKLAGLEFQCVRGNEIYPDGSADSLNIYSVENVPNATTFVVNVGVSTIQHNYIGGGNAFVGITTNIFPGNAQNSPRGSFFEVLDTPSSTSFSINVGVSSIAHAYARGGIVQVGVTTDLFPDGTQGEFFKVQKVLNEDSFIINSGISSIVHTYNSGGFASKYATYQSKTPQVLDASVIRVSGDCEAVAARVEQLAGIVTSIITEGIEAAPGGVQKGVSNATYDGVSGNLAVYLDQAPGVEVGDIVDVRNLTFKCSKSAKVVGSTYDKVTGKLTITTDIDFGAEVGTGFYLNGLEYSCGDGSLIYPENPAQLFIVEKVLSDTMIETTINPTEKVHFYVSGGTLTTQEVERIYPDNRVFKYEVLQVLGGDGFLINVGKSTIPHTYVTGGVVRTGSRYDVSNATYNNVTGLVEITTNGAHDFIKNTGVKLNNLRFACSSGGPNNAPGELLYPDGVPASVVGATYDNRTGKLSVTTNKPHQAYRNAKVRLEGLVFSCFDGNLTYPSEPDKLLRVTKVVTDYTYEVQLETSGKVHTYVTGGTSDVGSGCYKVLEVTATNRFTVRMAPTNIPHTYVSGGTVASKFLSHQIEGLNLRTSKCADDVKKIYLAVAHDITRGGNWKSVEAGKRYFDALGQIKFIAGGEIDQTVDILDYSLNVVRCVINNVSWGGVPRGYLTEVEKNLLSLPESTQTSVVDFSFPQEQGQFTTEKLDVQEFVYDNLSGIATVKTDRAHRMIKYSSIKFADLEFTCRNSPRITTNIFPDGTQGEIFEVDRVIDDNAPIQITDAIYDNETGEMIVETQSDNDIEKDTLVNLKNLRFQCLSGGANNAPGSLIYPDNPDYIYKVTAKPAPNQIVINVGVSTIPHTFSQFTDLLNVPQVKELPRKFEVHVGTVSFDHTYVGGGTVWEQAPFTRPTTATQLRDVSIQDDPIQGTNVTPNACANVFSAIENAVGVVTTIIAKGFDDSGISIRYPGNDGKGVATMEEMSSQGVGNIIKGPYIRNCTNFVPKSIGMRMDGFDAEPGDEISNGVQGSSNVDSFTQFNPGGIGCSVSNGTYQQLVSIFTICCDQAIVADSGAQLDLTNSNSSFGRLGLVARGIGDAKSKCIDRYTGVVAQEALIEDDTVIISGVGLKRPYDGQGIFFGELFREVVRVEVTDQGSGYDDFNPPFAFVEEPTGPSGIKAEVSPTVLNGKIVSIDVISNGNQYRDSAPRIVIDPPKDPEGRQAKARTITEPLYYDVDSSSEPSEGTVRVVFKQRLNNTVSIGTTVFFSRLSLQIASSHSFEYIGAGNEIDGARPSQGGVPIKANEIIKEDGGSIVYTSTDQAGNFNIGDDFVINQFTGTVTGRSFDQSVLNKVTPLIIALDS